MQDEIALVQQNGQAFVSSHEIAAKFGKRHADVLRLIHSYLDMKNLNDFNKRNFALANDNQAGRAKRGRPRLAEVLMTRDGFSLTVMSMTGERALEWKVKFIEAFNKMERLLLDEIPRLQARIVELEQNNKQNALPGPRKGYIRTPHIQINLWGEKDAIYYEMRPKNELDEHMKALAYLDLYDNMQRGIAEKRSIQIEIITKETLRDRAAVQSLAQSRFALLAPPKKKKQDK